MELPFIVGSLQKEQIWGPEEELRNLVLNPLKFEMTVRVKWRY